LLFETKIKIAQEAELARIEAERLEAERLAEVQKVEAERIEAQRIENEKLKAEAEILHKEHEKIQKRNLKLIVAGFSYDENNYFVSDFKRIDPATILSLSDADFENLVSAEKIEQDRINKIEQDRINDGKLERDRLAAELQAKKDAEELAHQKEKERIEAEESERKAADKAPDVDKLRKLYRDVQAFQIPEFTSKEGKKIGTEFQEGLNILLDMIKVSAEKLKL